MMMVPATMCLRQIPFLLTTMMYLTMRGLGVATQTSTTAPQTCVYDRLDDVRVHFKRRALLDDVPISIKRGRQHMTLSESRVRRREKRGPPAGARQEGTRRNITDVLRDAVDHRAIIKRSLQHTLEKEWATWCR